MGSMQEEVKFENGWICWNGEIVEGRWKDRWQRLKEKIKNQRREKKEDDLWGMMMQSEVYIGLYEKCRGWMSCYINARPGQKDKCYYNYARTDDRNNSMEKIKKIRGWNR